MNILRSLASVTLLASVALTSTGIAVADTENESLPEIIDTAADLVGVDVERDTDFSAENLGMYSASSIVGTLQVLAKDGEQARVLSLTDEGEGELILPGGQTDESWTEDGMAVVNTADMENVDFVVVPTEDGSVRIHSSINEQAAPERYDYRFPGVDVIILDEETRHAFLFSEAEGEFEVVGAVEAPWAVDANGVAVPTYFEADGDTLTQVVEHADSNFAYPIVADPAWWDNVKSFFKNASSYVVTKAKSAAKWLGSNSKWLAKKTWTGTKRYGPKALKFAAKKIGPGAVVLCAVGGGWAWYRSDATGWVRVGDTVSGCFL